MLGRGLKFKFAKNKLGMTLTTRKKEEKSYTWPWQQEALRCRLGMSLSRQHHLGGLLAETRPSLLSLLLAEY